MGIEGSDPMLARCQAEMAVMLAAWRALARRSHPAARAEAEAQVFAQMVVALDHRLDRGLDGAPAAPGPRAELRHLARGVTDHAGWFLPQGAWHPQGSVTGYDTGDRIRLTEAVFARLLSACLPTLASA